MYDNGFQFQHAIPIDNHGELLNGAHRVACAIAYDLPEIYTWRVNKEAWAPAWDYQWFIDNGMDKEDLEHLVCLWETICGKHDANA